VLFRFVENWFIPIFLREAEPRGFGGVPPKTSGPCTKECSFAEGWFIPYSSARRSHRFQVSASSLSVDEWKVYGG
jgi:hypothetical protein